MESNKYYKPTEDEIRVGLECVYTTLDNGFREDSFLNPENHGEDDIMTGEIESLDLSLLLRLYDTMPNVCEQIRVKKLDSEDIISLGFIEEGDENLFVSQKTYLGGSTGDDKKLITAFTEGDEEFVWVWIWYKDKRGNELKVFDGKIKNKSELKKILEMIGI